MKLQTKKTRIITLGVTAVLAISMVFMSMSSIAFAATPTYKAKTFKVTDSMRDTIIKVGVAGDMGHSTAVPLEDKTEISKSVSKKIFGKKYALKVRAVSKRVGSIGQTDVNLGDGTCRIFKTESTAKTVTTIVNKPVIKGFKAPVVSQSYKQTSAKLRAASSISLEDCPSDFVSRNYVKISKVFQTPKITASANKNKVVITYKVPVLTKKVENTEEKLAENPDKKSCTYSTENSNIMTKTVKLTYNKKK